LLPSGFTLIRIIILLLIRFSYFTITKPQTSGFGTNLKFKAKKYKSVLPQRPRKITSSDEKLNDLAQTQLRKEACDFSAKNSMQFLE
jgi:hypothetical protein